MNESVSSIDVSLASSILDAVVDAQYERATNRLLSSTESEDFDRALSLAVVSRWPRLDDDARSAWLEVPYSDGSADGLYNLGVALWAVDELEHAVAVFELAVAKGDTDALSMLGECELWMGRAEQGREHLKQVIASGGEHMRRAAGVLGHSLFSAEGRTDAEVIDLMTLAGVEDLDFPVNLATVLEQVGRRAEALAILEREMRAGNDRAPIVFGNILSEDPNGQADAEAAYCVGIELGDAYSAYNLSVLLDDQGRNEESHRWLKYAADHGDEKAQSRLAEPAAEFSEDSGDDVQ